VRVNELQELLHLIGFGELVLLGLDIHHRFKFGTLVEVMRSADPYQRKPEVFHQGAEILKPNILLIIFDAGVEFLFFAHAVIMPRKGDSMMDDMVIFTL